MAILLLNGSPDGASGNTAQALEMARRLLCNTAPCRLIDLAKEDDPARLLPEMEAASGFVFGTGTYWDGWGSPLQRALEAWTISEGTAVWLGKPAAVIVTMHAVGGKAVLSRLQGVLNSMGAWCPPHGGLVLSRVNQLALEDEGRPGCDDLWRPDDLRVVCHNLSEAITLGFQWRTWSVDRTDFRGVWMKA